MGWIKIIQSLAAYTGGVVSAYIGEQQLSVLFFIAAVLCDIAHILEERK